MAASSLSAGAVGVDDFPVGDVATIVPNNDDLPTTVLGATASIPIQSGEDATTVAPADVVTELVGAVEDSFPAAGTDDAAAAANRQRMQSPSNQDPNSVYALPPGVDRRYSVLAPSNTISVKPVCLPPARLPVCL